MMKRSKRALYSYWFVALLLISTTSLLAQPGGGGGLYIANFYDSELKPIDINSPSFHIEMYTVDSLKRVDIAPRLKRDMFFIPPNNNYSPNQKLVHVNIKYKSKIYKIDIEGIHSQNGGGVSEYMDSLVLDRPYVLSKRKRIEKGKSYGYDYWKYLYDLTTPLLRNGITPYTNKALNELGFTHFSEAYIDDVKRLPWEDDFMMATERVCANCNNDESEKYLAKAIKANNNQYNAPMLNLKIRLLSTIHYSQDSLNPKNAQAIIDLINEHTHLPLVRQFEDSKAEAYINLKQYDNAVLAYEKLEQQYAKDSLRQLHYTYQKYKVWYYQSKYKDIIQELAPRFKNITNDYFYNIDYRDDYFNRLNKFYFLYSLCLFIENSTTDNLERLKSSLANGSVFSLDYDFVDYLIDNYWMNTSMTHEKFQGFKLLYQFRKKAQKERF